MLIVASFSALNDINSYVAIPLAYKKIGFTIKSTL